LKEEKGGEKRAGEVPGSMSGEWVRGLTLGSQNCEKKTLMDAVRVVGMRVLEQGKRGEKKIQRPKGESATSKRDKECPNDKRAGAAPKKGTPWKSSRPARGGGREEKKAPPRGGESRK